VVSARTTNHARDELVRLSHSGLDTLAFRTEVIARLEKIIPHDTYWFPTVDPATLLVTGAVLKNVPEWAAPHFFENEFLRDDFNKFTELVTGPTPVNSLFEATHGDLERSERYRGLLADLGLGDDLRVALVDGSACWGYLCFHRERSSRGFTPADTAFLRPLVRHMAAGLRSSLLLAAQAGAAMPADPGLVVLAEDLSIVATSDAGARWLDELGSAPAQTPGTLPDAVCAAAARLLALERADVPASLPPPVARARTRSGVWLTLYASRLSNHGARGPVAIIIDRSEPLHIAPLIVQAYGLSARERQVTMLVLHGLSTTEIAQQLRISQNTVQDHLKAIFDKCSVHSRRDLAAQLAVRHYAPRGPFQRYAPRRASGTALTPGGWFLDETTHADRITLPPDESN
jgi:DNA-binding CsgD family transcriptional regulator